MDKLRALWNHPAGPRVSLIPICNIQTIHFWAPSAKWALVIAGIQGIHIQWKVFNSYPFRFTTTKRKYLSCAVPR